MSKLLIKGTPADDIPFVLLVTSPDSDAGYEILPSPDDLELELDDTMEWTVKGRNLRERTPEEVMLVVPKGKGQKPVSLTLKINKLMEKKNGNSSNRGS